jgi:hypothetical protein
MGNNTRGIMFDTTYHGKGNGSITTFSVLYHGNEKDDIIGYQIGSIIENAFGGHIKKAESPKYTETDFENNLDPLGQRHVKKVNCSISTGKSWEEDPSLVNYTIHHEGKLCRRGLKNWLKHGFGDVFKPVKSVKGLKKQYFKREKSLTKIKYWFDKPRKRWTSYLESKRPITDDHIDWYYSLGFVNVLASLNSLRECLVYDGPVLGNMSLAISTFGFTASYMAIKQGNKAEKELKKREEAEGNIILYLNLEEEHRERALRRTNENAFKAKAARERTRKKCA